MSNAKKCDRCDKFFVLTGDQFGRYVSGETPIWISAHKMTPNPDSLRSYEVEANHIKTRQGKIIGGDLCPSCSKELHTWWDAVKEVNE